MATQIHDLTGQKFGRLTVVKLDGRKGKNAAWLCQCECGNRTVIPSNNLVTGNTLSCGCQRRENFTNTSHGQRHTRLYRTWQGMKSRCFNPNRKSYPRYGGRGITVCDEWLKFEPFYEWAMSNGYTDELSIDRIDNDGNYCPENCRWVGAKTQANNKTNSDIIELNGERHTIAEWSEITGIGYATIYARIHIYNYSPEKALSKEVT